MRFLWILLLWPLCLAAQNPADAIARRHLIFDPMPADSADVARLEKKAFWRAAAETFGFKYVVSTLRESYSATHNGWKAMIYNGKEFYESKHYDINPIIDRVGGGDSFSGGIIHGLLTKPTQGEALEFAVAASALKHTINGDFNLVSVEEVESLAGGNANGRVQR